MQLREYLPFDVREVMRALPADGDLRHKFRRFTLSPRLEGRARSVRGFAEDLGFDVVELDLPKGVNGRITQDTWSDSGWRIEVNKNISVEAKRFTVLHELGHFYRHPHHDDPFHTKHFELGDGAFYADTKEEQEANEFAEAVLFGGGQMTAAFSLLSGDISKLARYFGVTKAVVEIAVRKLRCV